MYSYFYSGLLPFFSIVFIIFSILNSTNFFRSLGSILLRDIMSWAVSQEDGEASVTERTIQPPGSQIGNIADFAWHPSRENTLLAMGTLSRFTEWTVADRLTLNFSAR